MNCIGHQKKLLPSTLSRLISRKPKSKFQVCVHLSFPLIPIQYLQTIEHNLQSTSKQTSLNSSTLTINESRTSFLFFLTSTHSSLFPFLSSLCYNRIITFFFFSWIHSTHLSFHQNTHNNLLPSHYTKAFLFTSSLSTYPFPCPFPPSSFSLSVSLLGSLFLLSSFWYSCLLLKRIEFM